MYIIISCVVWMLTFPSLKKRRSSSFSADIASVKSYLRQKIFFFNLYKTYCQKSWQIYMYYIFITLHYTLIIYLILSKIILEWMLCTTFFYKICRVEKGKKIVLNFFTFTEMNRSNSKSSKISRKLFMFLCFVRLNL